MTRPRLVLLLALCAASSCRRAPAPALPESLSGWHRVSMREIPASAPPDAIGAVRVESIREAVYEGPGWLTARVYTLPSPAVAFAVAQRWHPTSQTVFFDSDRFFVVVQWERADRTGLQAFVSALVKRFERK